MLSVLSTSQRRPEEALLIPTWSGVLVLVNKTHSLRTSLLAHALKASSAPTVVVVVVVGRVETRGRVMVPWVQLTPGQESWEG